MTTSSISMARFVIYGSAIAEHARDLAQSGEWAKALNYLDESLEGMPMELSLAILRGEKTLEGSNNDIRVVDFHE